MLRHITLLILRQQPKSGSELMDEIEQYADWRPSPGSIYPMLAHLQEDGLIKSQPDQDLNLRRFILTETGEEEVDEHLRFDAQFRKRTRTIRKIYWRLHRKMPEDVYESFSTLLRQIDVTSRRVVDDPERRHLLIDMLDNTTEQLRSLEESPDE
jgi:DNA-binding PadR family transcriptional regulator